MRSEQFISRTLFSILIIAGAWIVVASPLNSKFLLASGAAVFFGIFMAVIAALRMNSFSTHIKYLTSYLLFDVALVSLIIAATTQALAAADLPAPFLALHRTPGIVAVYLSIAAVLAFAAILLILRMGNNGRLWAALLGAGLFSSTLYLRTFAVPEAGPVFGAVFGFGLLALFVSPAGRKDSNFSFLGISLRIWVYAFLTAAVLSVVLSKSFGPGIEYVSRIAVLIILAGLLATSITTRKAWILTAVAVLVVGGVIPIILAAVKYLSLVPAFGLYDALLYRFNPNEMGGANLISRSAVLTVPLVFVLFTTLRSSFDNLKRPERVVKFGFGVLYLAAGSLLVGGFFIAAYTQSWGSFLALVVSLFSYGVFHYWGSYKKSKFWPRSPLLFGIYGSGGLIITAVLLLGLFQLATQINVYSFNGRLIHWYGSVLTFVNNPVFGAGLGNENIYAPYAGSIRLLVDTQITTDAPLSVIGIDFGRSLRLHSHNLLLEFAAGSGILGFFTLIGSLSALLLGGFRFLGHHLLSVRLGAAACLAGIGGDLVWNMQDVLFVTPPLVSFPVWGLIGLLLAVDRLSNENNQDTTQEASTLAHQNRRIKKLHLALLPAAVIAFLLPAVSGSNYSAGFLAFQERRWNDAQNYLEKATLFSPYNPHLHAMLGQVNLESGTIDDAFSSYRRASSEKQDFSPYLYKLGWLSWLKEDLAGAKQFFQYAIESDPGEIWQDGLRQSLGLLYSAEGNYSEAVELFSYAMQIRPQHADTSIWQKYPNQISSSGSAVEVESREYFLDPVYTAGPSDELQKRILYHLGVADITPRHFTPSVETSPVSFSNVLGGMDRIRLVSDREANVLYLAAAAEYSRRLGLEKIAENTYLNFQQVQPNSSYGYRDLGSLYLMQRRFMEAQKALTVATEVSPGDISSWYRLALFYLEQQQWDKANQALNKIDEISRRTLFRSRLFDPDFYKVRSQLLIGQGKLMDAELELKKAIIIRDDPRDRISLANLYLQEGKSDLAATQCLEAASNLFRNWYRPLSPELWAAGICLAEASASDKDLERLVKSDPLLGNIVSGHVLRASGDYSRALEHYRSAAEARPDESSPVFFMGEIYQMLGEVELAKDHYQTAIELNPLESMYLLSLGKLYWTIGKQVEGLSWYQAAVELTPGWDQAQMTMANAYFMLNNFDQADIHFRTAAAITESSGDKAAFDFLAHLASAEIQAPEKHYISGDFFTIDGVTKRVLFMHPESRAAYSVDIPDYAGYWLTFDIGLSPDSWDKPGDGVAFSITIDDGSRKEIFSKYIDPKNNLNDRRWHSYSLDISAYVGKTVEITFQTSAGPSGNLDFDWAGWGEPRIIRNTDITH